MSISADFPFESRFVDVHGSQIHYVEQGEGSPILLLHGNPTSSYLWRNIIPLLSDQGRVIAMDLIGMGRSHKPEIEYRFVDHYRFVQGFIEALRLQHLTLVLHEWGSALGFHYAMTHESNVKGIAFMEAILEPIASFEAMPEAARELFAQLRDEDQGERMVIKQNFFVETMLPASVMRDMTRREIEAYRAPFIDPGARLPMLRWAHEMPIAGEPADVAEIITGYNGRLRQSEVPKLLLHATPGSLITPDVVAQLEQSLPNLTTEHVGDGIHFLPEDAPAEIGAALSKWIREL